MCVCVCVCTYKGRSVLWVNPGQTAACNMTHALFHNFDQPLSRPPASASASAFVHFFFIREPRRRLILISPLVFSTLSQHSGRTSPRRIHIHIHFCYIFISPN